VFESTNFRFSHNFNRKLYRHISDIYRSITNEQLSLQESFDRVDKSLNSLSQILTGDSKKILSEFLQNLIYYTYRVVKHDRDYQVNLISHIIKHPYFFYTLNNQVILHVDPEQKATTLIVLARNGDIKNLNLCLISLATALGLIKKNEQITKIENLLALLEERSKEQSFDRSIETLKKYLEFEDKDGFTAISTACLNGQPKSLNLLLQLAEALYNSKSSEGFKTLITKENYYKLRPLSLTIISDNCAVMNLILTAIFDAYQSDRKTLLEFLSPAFDKSALVTACTHANNLKIIEQLIIHILSKCFNNEKNSCEFTAFITTKNKFDSTLLHIACTFVKPETVNLLLNLIADFYKGQQTDGFKQFISARCKNGYSALQIACVRKIMEGITIKQDRKELTVHDIAIEKNKIITILTKISMMVYKNDLLGFIEFIKLIQYDDEGNMKYNNSKWQSMLNTKNVLNRPEILESILTFIQEELAQCEDTDYKKKCAREIREVLNYKSTDDFTLLNTLCKNALGDRQYQQSYRSIVIRIIQLGGDPTIKNLDHYSAWNNAPTAWHSIIRRGYPSPEPMFHFFRESNDKMMESDFIYGYKLSRS